MSAARSLMKVRLTVLVLPSKPESLILIPWISAVWLHAAATRSKGASSVTFFILSLPLIEILQVLIRESRYLTHPTENSDPGGRILREKQQDRWLVYLWLNLDFESPLLPFGFLVLGPSLEVGRATRIVTKIFFGP